MKVYVVKYALTQGVFIQEGYEEDGCFYGRDLRFPRMKENIEYAKTRDDAETLIKSMISKKIQSLKKAKDKLEKINIGNLIQDAEFHEWTTK
jgi:hypothetical protein